MATKKQLGLLALVILSASIYIYMAEEVKLTVDNYKSTFYVWENNSWQTGGVEYSKIYQGTSSTLAVSRKVIENTVGNSTTITREVLFSNGAKVKDIYKFDGNIKDKELFPVSHEIEIINGTGLIYQYEAQKLEYLGGNLDLLGKEEYSFGKNMTLTWDIRAYYAKLSKISTGGKVTLKYKINSSYEKINIRLFDPIYIANKFMPILERNEVFLDHGEGQFPVCNPTSFEVKDYEKYLSFFFNKVKGELTKFEIWTGETKSVTFNETIQVWIPNMTTKQIVDANGTYNVTVDNGYFNKTTIVKQGNETIYSLVNLSKTTNLKPKECRKILIKGYWDIKKMFEQGGVSLDWFSNLTISGVSYIRKDWAWWNVSFSKCRQIDIVGTGTALTDYQVSNNIPYDSDMQANFSDIRFTNGTCNNAGIELNHWLEQKVDSVNATFWIKVPSIAASGNTSLAMYYNASVASASNGTATFLLWDDFEDYTVGNLFGQQGWYQLGSGTNIWNISTAQSHSGTKSIKDTVNGDWGNYANKAFSLTSGVEMSNWMRFDSAGIFFSNYLGENNNTNEYGLGRDNNVNSGRWWYYTTGYVDTGISPSTSTWYKEKIRVRSDKLVDYYLYDSSGTLLWSGISRILYSNFTNGLNSVFMNGHHSGSIAYFDDYVVRKYSSPEPTLTVNAEEIPNTAPTITLNAPADNSWSTSKTVQFNYTPQDDSGFNNCSIWSNNTGSFAILASNSTSIINNSVNSISGTYTNDGTYLWWVECYDNGSPSLSNVSATNRTIKVDSTAPQYNTVGQNATTINATGSVLLYSYWNGSIAGLDTAWLSTNESGSWVNYSSTITTQWIDTESSASYENLQQSIASPQSAYDENFGTYAYVGYGSGSCSAASGNIYENYSLSVGDSEYSNITVTTRGTSYVNALGGTAVFSLSVFDYNSSSWIAFCTDSSTAPDPGTYPCYDYTFNIDSSNSTYWFVKNNMLQTKAYIYIPEACYGSVGSRYYETKIKYNFSWANFTWQNNSFYNGTFGWRIYANDTNGLTNVTDIATITMVPKICQEVNSTNSPFIMTNPVSSEGTCFTIGANNIILDGAGYVINYSKSDLGYAVNNSLGYDNITLKNLNIVEARGGFTLLNSHAIYGLGMQNSSIDNVTITSPGRATYGVFLDTGSDNVNITNSSMLFTSSAATYGIRIANSNNTRVLNTNISTDSLETMYLTSVNGLFIDNSQLFQRTLNGWDGIGIEGTNADITILRNNITSSGKAIPVLGSNWNISWNNLTSSGGSNPVLELSGMASGTIDGNTITGLGHKGIAGCSGIVIKNNFVNTTGSANGIECSSNTNLTSNSVYVYGSSSAVSISGASNRLLNNNLYAMGATGIACEVSGSSNNFTGGSCFAASDRAYSLNGAGATNNFTQTNFTGTNKIQFVAGTETFNFNNQTNGNIWINTNISGSGTISRTLSNWSNSKMMFNDTNQSSGLKTGYTILGMAASKNYNIYNLTSSGKTTRSQYSDSSGKISNFNVDLNGNTQVRVEDIPTLVINNPANSTYYTYALWFNTTASDLSSISSVWCSLDGGTNQSLTNSSGNWNLLNSSMGEGYRNVRCWANDTDNNVNQSELIYFTMAQANVTIYLNGTTNYTYFEADGSQINITAVANAAGNTLCLTIDHPDLGTNYICGGQSVESNITISQIQNKFNDSTSSKVLLNTSNITWLSLDSTDIPNIFTLNLSGTGSPCSAYSTSCDEINISFSDSIVYRFYNSMIKGTVGSIIAVGSSFSKTGSVIRTSAGSVDLNMTAPKNITFTSAVLTVNSTNESLLVEDWKNLTYVTTDDNYKYYLVGDTNSNTVQWATFFYKPGITISIDKVWFKIGSSTNNPPATIDVDLCLMANSTTMPCGTLLSRANDVPASASGSGQNVTFNETVLIAGQWYGLLFYYDAGNDGVPDIVDSDSIEDSWGITAGTTLTSSFRTGQRVGTSDTFTTSQTLTNLVTQSTWLTGIFDTVRVTPMMKVGDSYDFLGKIVARNSSTSGVSGISCVIKGGTNWTLRQQFSVDDPGYLKSLLVKMQKQDSGQATGKMRISVRADSDYSMGSGHSGVDPEGTNIASFLSQNITNATLSDYLITIEPKDSGRLVKNQAYVLEFIPETLDAVYCLGTLSSYGIYYNTSKIDGAGDPVSESPALYFNLTSTNESALISSQEVSVRTDLFNNKMSSCSLSNNLCDLKAGFGIMSKGSASWSNMFINFTFNTISINVTPSINYLLSRNGTVNVPLQISGGQNNYTISGLNLSFYGAKNYTVIANYTGSVIINGSSTKVLGLRYSNFSADFPYLSSELLFWINAGNMTNATPLGQSPWQNGTTFNFSRLWNWNIDLGIKLNQSLNTCLTFFADNDTSQFIASTSYQKIIKTNPSLTRAWGINYRMNATNCNRTALGLYTFYPQFRSCCSECYPCL